jgi:peptidoglycan/LPS O-acetylase OafA/YrhL
VTGTALDHRSEPGQSYLPFLNGLRAIAVMSVVFYHIAPAAFPGGYVGVDVFFVISGFLIINQIVAGLSAGTFSFAHFWSRRALRILPPYLVVIAASLLIASRILVTADEFESFGNEVLYSSLMVVNFYFLHIQGYFDTAATSKPLLHLWSLAVEEQFYLLAPLLIAAAFWLKLNRWAVAGGVAALFVTSFIGCVLLTGTGKEPNYAFYLTPLRAWEFVAGGMLSALTVVIRRLPSIVAEVVTASGCALIVACVFILSPETPFPSYWAALPVTGAVAVIAGGCANPRTVAARFLALPPMVGIGLMSYEWYLWHWPLLTFARIYNYGDANLPVDIFSGGFIALLLAYGTRRFIEQPIAAMRSRRFNRLGWGHVVSGLSGATVCAIAGLYLMLQTSPNLAASQAEVRAASTDRLGNCWLAHRMMGDHSKCFADTDRPLGLLLGDSYAAVGFPPLHLAADRAGTILGLASVSACAALIDSQTLPACARGYDTIRKVLGDNAIDYAILFSRWVIYTPWTVKVADGYKLPLTGSGIPKTQFVGGLGRTIAMLKQRGVKRILIVAPLPEFDRSGPACYFRAKNQGQSIDEKCSIRRDQVDMRRLETMAWIREAAAQDQAIRIVDPIDAFCDAVWCRPYDDSGVLYMDSNHLRHVGTQKLVEAFPQSFEWAFKGSR